MAIKLDLKDKKILILLDENARLSNSQIAKKVGLSKPAVEYRLKRFEKNKIIFQYYTIINFTKLGYSQYKIYFKFQDTNLEDKQKIIDYWKNDKNSVWVAQIRGKWDLAVSVIARSNFEFGKNVSRKIRPIWLGDFSELTKKFGWSRGATAPQGGIFKSLLCSFFKEKTEIFEENRRSKKSAYRGRSP